ncbi:hypothetical protein L602_002400000040 [Cupriavidus gilardii J11]|uniref:YCII-related domain-containing protein n=1 Tax=Cupriavidus gilardii J11 TaxID=936133 RepID=A0A562BJX3_9BURK|nr:YciI family protein [Cupriavidus gilardii]TWG85558.1 hypothetical protein L602_002400000040 [Cupriavidus gilardii J11]
MKYLCLIYADERAIQAMTEREWRELVDDCLRYRESLCRDGIYVAGEALESVASATTLRVRGRKVGITDGPFAETKEQLGGFYLIEAEGLHEALHVAAGIPAGRFGSIEVRPVMTLHAQTSATSSELAQETHHD